MLTIELCGEVVWVFYRSPHSTSCGGTLGSIWPGGHFRGVPYDRLKGLGDGDHDIAIDIRHGSELGTVAGDSGEDDRCFFTLRKRLFWYRMGACTASDIDTAAIQAMTPKNAGRVAAYLPPEFLRKLRDYAASIPETKALRGQYCRWYDPRRGGSGPVADEKLTFLREWFIGTVEPDAVRQGLEPSPDARIGGVS